MGYCVRVLGTSDEPLPVELLRAVIDEFGLAATVNCETEDQTNWKQLILSHSDGTEIALIERGLVREGSLATAELSEFDEEIAKCHPKSAVEWLRAFFPKVRVIYAFQLLSGTDHKNGWDILGTIKALIGSIAPSIFQADSEGFSNKDGDHILWQFSESVDGAWSMAVLDGSKWIQYEMDLGNQNHREAFFRGEVPDGVIPSE